tara:strand:- start:789 stop:1244 length:456 start_codon:yes stop_codon:yes gene_type:complete
MKRVYIDLDGVLADFEKGRKNHPLGNQTPYKGRPDKLPGLYKDLEPIKGSINAVNKLLNNSNFDIYFLSTAPWDNPNAWTNKRLWIGNHFDEKLIRKRLILCHHKNFLKGDILIDDKEWNGAKYFEGEWIKFGSENYPDWQSVMNKLEELH